MESYEDGLSSHPQESLLRMVELSLCRLSDCSLPRVTLSGWHREISLRVSFDEVGTQVSKDSQNHGVRMCVREFLTVCTLPPLYIIFSLGMLSLNLVFLRYVLLFKFSIIIGTSLLSTIVYVLYSCLRHFFPCEPLIFIVGNPYFLHYRLYFLNYITFLSTPLDSTPSELSISIPFILFFCL